MGDIRIAELTVGNKGALAALGDVAKVMDSVGGVAETNVKRLAGVTREFGALARASGVYIDASDKMARATEQANRALDKGKITAEQHARIMETARARYDANAAAAAREARAIEDATAKKIAKWDAEVREREANAAMIIAAERAETEARQKAAAEARKEADAFEALTDRLDREGAATRRVAADKALLDKALAGQIAGVSLTAQQHALLTRRLNESARAQESYAAATTRANTAASAIRGAAGQVGYQVQDIAVQLAGGQNAALVVAQQGSQIAGAFGPAGAAIGAVIAVAGAAAMALGALGGEEKRAKELADAHTKTRDTLNNVLGQSANSVDDLADRYRTLNAEMRKVEEAALLQTARKAGEEMDKLRATVPDKLDDLRASSPFRAGEYEKRLSELGAPTGEAAKRLQEFNAATAEIEKFQKGGTVPALVAGLLNIADAGGPMAAELRKAAGELSDGARKADELDATGKRVAGMLALLKGDASGAAAGLVGFGDAAGRAGEGLARMRTEQARAGASLFKSERDLDRQIAALRGGEAAMRAFGEEQVRTAARGTAYDAAVKSGLSTLDATAEANRIATKSVEAYRLEQDRASKQGICASTAPKDLADRDDVVAIFEEAFQ